MQKTKNIQVKSLIYTNTKYTKIYKKTKKDKKNTFGFFLLIHKYIKIKKYNNIKKRDKLSKQFKI